MKFTLLICGLVCSSAVLAQAPPTSEPARAQPANAAKPTEEKSQAPTQADSQGRQMKSATRADRLDLETTIVTGNRELPKVLYIVPWKKAEIGDLPAQPFNTLLDEVLAPVDRDVFKREVNYFQTVSQSAAAAAPNASGTKPATESTR